MEAAATTDESGPSKESIQVVDQFRVVDRKIKALVKRAELESTAKQRKKRAWEESQGVGRSQEEWKDAWDDVVDVVRSEEQVRYVATLPKCCALDDHECSCAGETKVFELRSYPPGLFIVRNALCKGQQHKWAKVALEDYSREDHTNLSNLSKLAESDAEASGNYKVGDFDDIWRKSCADNDGFQRFRRLRWSCLGYHYDWTHRCYQKNLKSTFPEELSNFCQQIAQAVDQDIVPEAAIVNYYPVGSCMGGHIDDAEHDLEKPIISLSLGRTAIFLIGGQKKDVAPTPILLRSGDAVMMTGESRLCYHGVGGILSASAEEYLTGDKPFVTFSGEGMDAADRYVSEYLQLHRINMNVRQVRIGLSDDNWIDKTGSGYQAV